MPQYVTGNTWLLAKLDNNINEFITLIIIMLLVNALLQLQHLFYLLFPKLILDLHV